MKKIILAIFLMLGVLSFASPESLPDYVDKEKFQENGYHIRVSELLTTNTLRVLELRAS